MWCSGSYEHICLRVAGLNPIEVTFAFFLNLIILARRGNPIEVTFAFFNLIILARRGMHVGMRMSFTGRGE
jgi:hypothetical protein